jgi:predicted HicB family RNase H-like nuclease
MKTTRQLNIRIPAELHQQLAELAKEDRRSMTQLVIMMLEKQLASQALSELKEAIQK